MKRIKRYVPELIKKEILEPKPITEYGKRLYELDILLETLTQKKYKNSTIYQLKTTMNAYFQKDEEINTNLKHIRGTSWWILKYTEYDKPVFERINEKSKINVFFYKNINVSQPPKFFGYDMFINTNFIGSANLEDYTYKDRNWYMDDIMVMENNIKKNIIKCNFNNFRLINSDFEKVYGTIIIKF